MPPIASPPRTRSLDDLRDRDDLRHAIVDALQAPMDDRALRDAIFTYVGAERDAAVSSGRVILAITEMAEAAPGVTPAARTLLVRRSILWTVEAFFGHLGGDVFARRAAPAHAPTDVPPDAPAAT